jgi:hypothetical protein
MKAADLTDRVLRVAQYPFRDITKRYSTRDMACGVDIILNSPTDYFVGYPATSAVRS